MQNKSETELIAQSLDDNHDAYGILVDRYKNAIYHHCFAIVHDEDLAEDISQETFITAFYKLERYKPEYKFSTWLFKIATNKALNVLKKRRKEFSGEEVFKTMASELPEPMMTSCYKNCMMRSADLRQNIGRLLACTTGKVLVIKRLL